MADCTAILTGERACPASDLERATAVVSASHRLAPRTIEGELAALVSGGAACGANHQIKANKNVVLDSAA
jgi:hypothetical protein